MSPQTRSQGTEHYAAVERSFDEMADGRVGGGGTADDGSDAGPQLRAEAKANAATPGRKKKSTGRTFDPSSLDHQGYVDPGAAAGRGPTSGETQFEYGCRQGYITQGC